MVADLILAISQLQLNPLPILSFLGLAQVLQLNGGYTKSYTTGLLI